MKKRKRKPNKGTKAYEIWKAKLDLKKKDQVWSKTVRERDGNKCVLCGESPKALNAHHILPKEFYPTLRHEEMNGISVCPMKCHRREAHWNGVVFAIWLQENRPEQWAWVVANRKLRMEVKKVKKVKGEGGE